MTQTATRAWLFLWAYPCVYLHVLYSFFLLINTLLVSLLSIFVGILFLQSCRARALSLTTGLVARIQCFCRHNPTSITGQELKPCFKSLQAKATQDHLDYKTPHNFHPLGWDTSFEGISLLWPPLLGKAIKLFFSTSPKTLSARFNSVLGCGGWIWLCYFH